MSAPSRRMAVGVRSSGSTDMPPVKMRKSAPWARWARAAETIMSRSSSQTVTPTISPGQRASLARTTGSNLSLTRPVYTSEPVMTTPARRGW